ncbi:MAG: hypothetical protein ACRCTW_05105, partial [Lactococcus garvieae]
MRNSKMDHLMFKAESQDKLPHRFMFRLNDVEYSFDLTYGDLMVKLKKYHNIDIYVGNHVANNKIAIEESGYDYLQEHENGGKIGVCVYDMKA